MFVFMFQRKMENFYYDWPMLEEGEIREDYEDPEEEVSISKKCMFHALGKLSSEVYLLMC